MSLASGRLCAQHMLDMVTSICALAISAISIFMVWDNGNDMQRLVHANSWPALQLESGNGNDKGELELSFSVHNAGIGPDRVHDSQFALGVWSDSFFPGSVGLWLLVTTISRKVNQLNFPLHALATAKGIDSEIVLLKDDGGAVRYAGWYRRLMETGRAIYTGFYMTERVPRCDSPCVKVVFPMPAGNATVILRPTVDVRGQLRLSSQCGVRRRRILSRPHPRRRAADRVAGEPPPSDQNENGDQVEAGNLLIASTGLVDASGGNGSIGRQARNDGIDDSVAEFPDEQEKIAILVDCDNVHGPTLNWLDNRGRLIAHGGNRDGAGGDIMFHGIMPNGDEPVSGNIDIAGHGAGASGDFGSE